MEYAKLAKCYQHLEATTKRLEKTRILSQFLQQVPEKELEAVMLLVQGRVYPLWDSRDMGVSSKLIVKAIRVATGKSEKDIEQQWAKVGDLGVVAAEYCKNKGQATLFSEALTVQHVFKTLQKLSSVEGVGSVDQKLKLVAQLISSAKGEGAKFIVRTVLSELRVGIAEGTLRDAICWAYLEPPIDFTDDTIEIQDREAYNQLIAAVQSAYDRTNDFGKVAIVAKKGVEALLKVPIEPGNPLKVMLAQKEGSITDALKRTGEPAQIEYKYDGFRLLATKKRDGTIKLFTRRQEEVTRQFPEVVAAVSTQVAGEEFIIDGEAVGFDPSSGNYLPFQHVSQRIKRKHQIIELSKKIPVELNVFDILYHDGKSYLQEPLQERRKVLEQSVSEKQRSIRVSQMILADSAEDIQTFYEESLAAGNEGIMIKDVKAIYRPGSRVGTWIKLKPTMAELDLVIIRAEWGEGKRSGWLTSFSVACRDEEGSLLEIGKFGTGMKELEQEEGVTFTQMTETLSKHVISRDGREVTVEPVLVVEVRYEEIQKSPSYSSGYALRFPRLVRLREDRGVEDISSITEVEKLFKEQKS